MLSVMFLSATLMVGASTNASLGASIGEAYRNADLVATSKNGEAFTQAAVEAAASAPAVEDSYAERSTYVMFEAGGGEQYGRLRNAAPASLEGAILTSGSMPSKASEAVIDVKTAEHLGLTVGSMLELHGAGPVKTAKVSITGLIQATNDPFSSSAAQLIASESVLNAVQDAGAGFTGVQFSLKVGEDVAAAKEYITHRMEAAGATGPVLETAQEKVTSTVAMLSAGQDQLTVVLLAFAGVAILVSTLVVANTFSVLVAQRTRELALLRCLGAGRAQIRGSVMLEALVVGFLSSVVGVLAATGLMTGLIAWAKSQPEQAFATLAVPPSAIIAGLVAGTLLTVVAALVPAKAATAVAPLAALRPSDDASVRNKRGRVRLALGLVALLGGAAALVYGSVNVSLGVALLGGAASFVGILLCSTLFIPTVVALAGRLACAGGSPGQARGRECHAQPCPHLGDRGCAAHRRHVGLAHDDGRGHVPAGIQRHPGRELPCGPCSTDCRGWLGRPRAGPREDQGARRRQRCGDASAVGNTQRCNHARRRPDHLRPFRRRCRICAAR